MFRDFRNVCAAGFVAATVFCAGIQLPAAHAAELMQTYGAWHGFVANETGEKGFGVLAHAGDGGSIGLVVKGDDIAMMMTCPDWRMTAGEKLPVRIIVDGEGYGGDALVVDKGMIKLPGVTNDIVLRLAHGREATVKIGRAGLVWNVSLEGFAAALEETVRTYARGI